MSASMSELLANQIVGSSAKLQRGKLWCLQCGKTIEVDSVKSLLKGWATCCGQTMSLDSPHEREFEKIVAEFRGARDRLFELKSKVKILDGDAVFVPLAEMMTALAKCSLGED